MNPADFLTIIIEVSVATLGFTALASTIGDVSTSVRKVGVRVIYEEALTVFLVSVLTLLLMYTPLESEVCWKVMGAIYCFTRPFALIRINSDRKELIDTVSRIQVFIVASSMLTVVVLQIANLWWGEFWPLASAIFYSLVLAVGSFVEFFRSSPFARGN